MLSFSFAPQAQARVRTREETQSARFQFREEEDFEEPMQKVNVVTKKFVDKTLDCMEVFVAALISIPELVQARNQLQEAIQDATAPLAQELVEDCADVVRVEQVAREQEEEQEQVQVATNKLKPEKVIFVYGPDSTRIRVVVESAINQVFQNQAPLQTLPIIVLTAEKVKRISAHGLRALLATEFRALRNPPKLVVLLEEVIPALLSDYLDCGFLESSRSKGVKVITLGWSSTYQTEDFGTQFYKSILVPGRMGENQGERRRQEDVVVRNHNQNPVVSKAAGEVIYAQIQKKEKPKKKEEHQPSQAAPEIANAKSPNQGEQNVSGLPKTSKPPRREASADVESKSVIVTQPAPPSRRGGGLSVLWKKANAEPEQVDLNGKNQNDWMKKKEKKEASEPEVGFWTSCASCLCITYACFLD